MSKIQFIKLVRTLPAIVLVLSFVFSSFQCTSLRSDQDNPETTIADTNSKSLVHISGTQSSSWMDHFVSPCWLTDERIVNWHTDVNLLVRTVNIHNNASDACARLHGIVDVFHHEFDWPSGIIALQEVPGSMSDCEGISDNGAHIFSKILEDRFRTTADSGYSANNQVGAVTSGDWEIMEKNYWHLKSWKYCNLYPKRYLLELKLRHKEKGWILRFYSAHLSNTSPCKRFEQAKQVTKIVRERVSAGELLPIVAGDFNAGHNLAGYKEPEQSVREMENYFYRPHDQACGMGDSGIDLIYIGKKLNFPQCKGYYIPIRTHDVRFLGIKHSVEGFPDFNDQLTNHEWSRGMSFKIMENDDPWLYSRVLIDNTEYKGSTINGIPPQRCDQFDLTFSWKCNFDTSYNLSYNSRNILYTDPLTGNQYNKIPLPEQIGKLTIPINFIIPRTAGYLYKESIMVWLRRTFVSATRIIPISPPRIEALPYIHRLNQTIDPESQYFGVIIDAEEKLDDVVIKTNIDASAAQTSWHKRVYVQGNPIGEPVDSQAIIPKIVTTYHLGYIPKPISCTYKTAYLLGGKIFSGIKIHKTSGNETGRETISPFFENGIACRGFTTNDFETDYSVTIKYCVSDSVLQRTDGEISFFGKSLICMQRICYLFLTPPDLDPLKDYLEFDISKFIIRVLESDVSVKEKLINHESYNTLNKLVLKVIIPEIGKLNFALATKGDTRLNLVQYLSLDHEMIKKRQQELTRELHDTKSIQEAENLTAEMNDILLDDVLKNASAKLSIVICKELTDKGIINAVRKEFLVK